MRVLLILLALCGGMASLLGAEAFEQWFHGVIYQAPDFSEDENASLRRGKIISRVQDIVSLDRKPLMFFRVYGVIDLKPEECWRQMQRLGEFYQTQPLMVTVEPERSAGQDVWLRHTIRMIGMTFHYVNRFQLEGANRLIVYTLERSQPHNIDDHFGFWHVHAWENGKTLLEHGTYMDPGFKYPMPKWLVRQISLLDFPNTIKRARLYFAAQEKKCLSVGAISSLPMGS